MLARGFRILLTLQGVLLLAWLLVWWSHSVTVALAGVAWGLLWHGGVMAWQFARARQCCAQAGLPPPGLPVLLRAWAAELRQSFQVFGWRQPFRAAAEPDFLPQTATGRRGVLLLHGYLCNRGFWTPWLRRLRAAGHPAMAINLEPVFGGIDAYADRIEAAVVRLTAVTGQPPVVVCHSMGGLAVRAWLQQPGAEAMVGQVVTLGTPHHGTWLGRFGTSRNARQMRPDSRWLQALASCEPASRRARFVCYFSNCDNIVFPARTATLEGADNRFVPGLAHVAMAFDARVMDEVLGRP